MIGTRNRGKAAGGGRRGPGRPRGPETAKISISVNARLLADARARARAAGRTLSAEVNDMMERRSRQERLLTLLDQWEAEDGPSTEDEKAAARADIYAAFGIETPSR
jgi:hypothetical protein